MARCCRENSPTLTSAAAPFRFGAKFGSAILLASLVLLAAANFIGAPLWTVTLSAAGALVAGNWWQHYFRPWWRRRRRLEAR